MGSFNATSKLGKKFLTSNTLYKAVKIWARQQLELSRAVCSQEGILTPSDVIKLTPDIPYLGTRLGTFLENRDIDLFLAIGKANMVVTLTGRYRVICSLGIPTAKHFFDLRVNGGSTGGSVFQDIYQFNYDALSIPPFANKSASKVQAGAKILGQGGSIYKNSLILNSDPLPYAIILPNLLP